MATVSDTELRAVFPLVAIIVAQLRRAGHLAAHLERDDLEAVGRAAAWLALQRVDPAAPPKTRAAFLSIRIRGALIDYQRTTTRAEGWHRSAGRVATIGRLDEPATDDQDLTVADRLQDPVLTDELAEQRERLAGARRALSGMPARMRVVAENLLADEPRTLAAVGAELGVTESRACQLAREARQRMRAAA